MSFRKAGDVIEEVCAAYEPIKDKDQWFRVRQEYVHLSCAEKYLRRVSERRKESAQREPEK